MFLNPNQTLNSDLDNWRGVKHSSQTQSDTETYYSQRLNFSIFPFCSHQTWHSRASETQKQSEQYMCVSQYKAAKKICIVYIFERL